MKVSAPPRPSRDRQLLEAIARAHSEFIASGDFRKIFEGLLEILLELTNSEYGFIGQVLSQNGSRPYLKMYAITNISWNPDTRKLYEEAAADGLEFHNLQTLFGHALTTGEAVIANKPSADPRSGGVPKGHPPLNAFLGLPIKLGDSMVGMAGVANRPEGYDRDLIDFLEPFLLTCGSLISTIRSSEKREVVEAALRSSELRTRAVLESTLDAIITSNEDGIIESVNPATERMFGYEAEDLIGRNVSVLMPQPSAGEHDESIRHYLQTGAPNIIGIGREVTGLRKDGSTFPINLSITEVDLPGHRLFTGIIRDISDRKEAEAQLEKTLAELESSHDDLLAILNETEMGIVMVDENGRISFMSRSCAEMLEMNQENFIGTAWQEVCPFTAEQKRRLQEMFDADVSARERLSAQLHLPDGTESWAEVEVRDDPRDPAGKIFFLYDVTEVHRLRSRLNTVSQTQMVGKSPDMQKMFGIFDKIAPGDWTVLIEGETGVGKELVAQGLHAASPRREGPFIAVNCAGLTDSLLTSQLFGHRRGAFTGAVRDQEGLFEAATGGTLFLDEIGEVPMGVQAALLRVLQEKELTRVGETMPRKVDVRILAATNRDLAKDVADGRFRKDLLYRLQVARLRVPELRHRREDIPLLVATFLAEARRLKDGRVKGVHPDAMRLLVDHAWPGNVRELKNAIDRAIIHCDSQVIEVDDLPREVQGSAPGRLEPEEPEDWRSRLMAALAQAEGNRSRAARLLGISRATLYRRLAEAGIEAKQPRGPEAAERASDRAVTPGRRDDSP